MTSPSIEILRSGALTTVQDLGRPGHQRDGVSVCGAMDPFAAAVANILAGNAQTAAVLEATILGPEILFEARTQIALAGADLNATIDGQNIEPWSSAVVDAGRVLRFGKRLHGTRVYIAFGGGVDTPLVMGSKATDVKGGFGGHYGRALKSGDRLSLGPALRSASNDVRSLVPSDLEKFRPPGEPIRVLRTGSIKPSSDDAWNALVGTLHKVSPNSDRMGLRLDGTPLPPNSLGQNHLYSEPVCRGTIQLPPNGTPIVLMADSQTVGGYPKIGTVITVDIARLCQIAPGEQVRFVEVSLTEAQRLLGEERQYLRSLDAANC